jgi:hypothetical protein
MKSLEKESNGSVFIILQLLLMFLPISVFFIPALLTIFFNEKKENEECK